MAYFGVRIRILQDMDLVVSADTQVEAETAALTFRTPTPSNNILKSAKFGSEISSIRNSMLLPITNEFSKINARQFTNSIIDNLSTIVNDTSISIDETEYNSLKTKLIELKQVLDNIK